eukprot:1013179-Heterocapsa_arctica.AAC.1
MWHPDDIYRTSRSLVCCKQQHGAPAFTTHHDPRKIPELLVGLMSLNALSNSWGKGESACTTAELDPWRATGAPSHYGLPRLYIPALSPSL